MSIFEKSKGTVTDPFKIYTEDDLIELTNYGDLINPDLHYQLQNDIHLVKEWVRGIGHDFNNAFSGTFDGNGYKISNVFNSNVTAPYFGLFRITKGATIKNLEVDGVNYSTRQGYTGALVGVSNGGTLNIINTAVKNVNINIVDSSKSGASAFVGTANGGHVHIKDSYAYNVRITRPMSASFGSGVIVAYIQSRNVTVENVIVFGEVHLHSSNNSYSGRNTSFNHGYNNGGSFSGNLIQATTSSTHNLSNSQRTETPLVKDSYPNTISFGPQQGWDMVDGELPFLTYLGTRVNPRKISVKEDLSLIDEFSYDYFELVNDIEVNTTYGSYVFENIFYGTIDGNGYGLYGIDIYHRDPSTYLALFQRFYGHMKDITIDMNRVYVTRNSGRVSSLAYYFGGKIRNVRVNVGTLRGGTTNNGLLGYISEGTDVKNCFLYVETFNIYSSTADVLGGLLDSSYDNNLDITIENNIFHINSILATNASFVQSTNENIKNNILYVGEGRVDTHTGQQIRVSSLREFRDPDNSAYDSFDKDVWVFRDGEDPIQSVFVKITEKIEERLVSLYSKGMYLETKWTNSFIILLESFTREFTLRMKLGRLGTKKIKNSVEKIYSNIIKRGTRRHKRGSKSFTKVFSIDIKTSSLFKVLREVLSFSGHMRGFIRKASNIYEFQYRMVENQMSKVSTGASRLVSVIRISKSYSGMITTFIKRLSKITAPAEIFARAIARTNNVRMKVKESFTKIRASNGGGD